MPTLANVGSFHEDGSAWEATKKSEMKTMGEASYEAPDLDARLVMAARAGRWWIIDGFSLFVAATFAGFVFAKSILSEITGLDRVEGVVGFCAMMAALHLFFFCGWLSGALLFVGGGIVGYSGGYVVSRVAASARRQS